MITKTKTLPRRLLVVEDDDAVRDSIETVLVDRVHEVETARNAEQALNLLRERARPDAIIVDLIIVLDLEAFDADLRSIPVVLLTVQSHEPMRLRNVIGVFRKSTDLQSMFEALNDHCATAAS